MHDVIIIGGGAAGMQAAVTLAQMGVKPLVIERERVLGGKLNSWYKLAPSFTLSQDVVDGLLSRFRALSIESRMESEVALLTGSGVELSSGEKIGAKAVIISTGAEVFDATLKEEYGYKVYDNVLTTADLEQRLKEGNLNTVKGSAPKRVAFIHCVGSRDAKVCREYCSRLCCITAVKQAIEIRELLPDTQVYNFYMDIRMFGPMYEEIYRQAQEEFNVHFVRGRVSEASETIDGAIQIKAEDTLISRPLKMSVDMLVLAVGMSEGRNNEAFAKSSKAISRYKSGYIEPADLYGGNVCSAGSNIFYAGTVTAPKSVGEAMNEGVAAAYKVLEYLKV